MPNPFQNALEQLKRVAKILNLEEKTLQALSQPD